MSPGGFSDDRARFAVDPGRCERHRVRCDGPVGRSADNRGVRPRLEDLGLATGHVRRRGNRSDLHPPLEPGPARDLAVATPTPLTPAVTTTLSRTSVADAMHCCNRA